MLLLTTALRTRLSTLVSQLNAVSYPQRSMWTSKLSVNQQFNKKMQVLETWHCVLTLKLTAIPSFEKSASTRATTVPHPQNMHSQSPTTPKLLYILAYKTMKSAYLVQQRNCLQGSIPAKPLLSDLCLSTTDSLSNGHIKSFTRKQTDRNVEIITRLHLVTT
jgi:hypothetical protein